LIVSLPAFAARFQAQGTLFDEVPGQEGEGTGEQRRV
jgi:hypothetical protein